MKRALLALAVLVAPALAVAAPQPVSAAPGGDAMLVVQTVTMPSPATFTVMCPEGFRALGGGVAPVASSPGYYSRYAYSAPVDASGNPASAGTGDVPRGWTVSAIGLSGGAVTSWRAFATCAATSDATVVSSEPSDPAVKEVAVPCPAGQRAVGGGVGQTDPGNLMPDGTHSGFLMRSSAVGSSNSALLTGDDAVPTAWSSRAEGQSYGRRFIAICSAQSDATVQVTDHAPVGMGGNTTAASAACPAGQVAVSGGVGGSAEGGSNGFVYAAPTASVGEVASLTTGYVPTAWVVEGRSAVAGNILRTIVVCITAQARPVPDTTAPDATFGKVPQKKTFKNKATFTFSSEPGATFTCQLDAKPATACTSPHNLKKLKPGKHTLRVTAKDGAGNADASPATYTWKVKKKPKPKPPSGCTGECR